MLISSPICFSDTEGLASAGAQMYVLWFDWVNWHMLPGDGGWGQLGELHEGVFTHVGVGFQCEDAP